MLTCFNHATWQSIGSGCRSNADAECRCVLAAACPRGKAGMTGALHLSSVELAQRGMAGLGAARLSGELKLVEDLGMSASQVRGYEVYDRHV